MANSRPGKRVLAKIAGALFRCYCSIKQAATVKNLLIKEMKERKLECCGYIGNEIPSHAVAAVVFIVIHCERRKSLNNARRLQANTEKKEEENLINPENFPAKMNINSLWLREK